MKFEVDEVAVVVSHSRDACPDAPQIGEEVTVVAVGPFPAGTTGWLAKHPRVWFGTTEPTDYYVRDAHGYHWFCKEPRLRKRRPPQQAGSWDAIAEYTKWHPRRIEERV